MSARRYTANDFEKDLNSDIPDFFLDGGQQWFSVTPANRLGLAYIISKPLLYGGDRELLEYNKSIRGIFFELCQKEQLAKST